MPVYEYQCETCGTVTNLKHAFREDPPTRTCPACGAAPLKRKFNAAGIIFKGSGYYINDSRTAKTESAAKSETTTSAPAPAPVAAPTPPKSDAAA